MDFTPDRSPATTVSKPDLEVRTDGRPVHPSAAEMPVFEGAAELVECLRTLIRRPRIGEAPRSSDIPRHGRGTGLPMLCLIRADDDGRLIQGLASYLARARPRRIPHTVHRLPTLPAVPPSAGEGDEPLGERDIQAIGAILLALSKGLGSASNSRDGRVRFIRFGLIRWLINQNLDVEDADADRVLRSRLDERDLARAQFSWLMSKRLPELADVAGPLSRWLRLLLFLPLWWSRVRIAGRVPGVGIEYRWLVRQPFLAPRDPGTPQGFAERLTTGQRPTEDPAEVCRLMVNAFLADLRVAYGRRPWRLRGARRTTYPVALLDGVTRENHGHLLLRLVNDVRNDTGRFDPLLVVAAGPTLPLSRDSPRVEEMMWPAGRADHAYQAWCQRFPAESRARVATAWYLPLRVPPGLPSSPTPTGLDDGSGLPGVAPLPAAHLSATQELARTAPFQLRKAPVWSRRTTVVAALVALTLATAWVVRLHVLSDRRADRLAQAYVRAQCGVTDPAAARWLLNMGAFCVGITDGTFAFQTVDPRMTVLQNAIRTQNMQAVKQHQMSPRRPYVTLVYLARLNAVGSTNSGLVNPRKQLLGVVAAQAESLHSDSASPILRVLLANAGTSIKEGPRVARMIETMAAEDPSLVGVVGLAESRTDTIETIKELGSFGLPVVAATLSADHVQGKSFTYFQVSPPNSREGALVVNYVKHLFALPGGPAERAMRVIQSVDADDKYSKTLYDDVSRDAVGIPVKHLLYRPNGFTGPTAQVADGAYVLGGHQCGYRGVVFWAGRPSDFATFLSGLQAGCPGDPPTILADDDTASYAGAEDAGDGRPQPAITYDYVAFAVGPAQCGSTYPYLMMRQRFPRDCQRDGVSPSIDGYALLAYDAVNVYLQAARRIDDARFPVNVPLMGQAIRGSTLPGGSSGNISFTDPKNPGIPVDKSISIVRMRDGKTPDVIGTCAGAKPAYDWCPAPSSQR